MDVSYLIVVVEDSEVTDREDNLVEKFFRVPVWTIPYKVTGDMTELQWCALLSQRTLKERKNLHKNNHPKQLGYQHVHIIAVI